MTDLAADPGDEDGRKTCTDKMPVMGSTNPSPNKFIYVCGSNSI